MLADLVGIHFIELSSSERVNPKMITIHFNELSFSGHWNVLLILG